MQVHLIDGTYELFRHFFAVPPHARADGQEVGAVRGVLASLVGLLEEGATHVGVATDHVIESFRNDLYPGYKTGAGIDPALRSQFDPLEETLAAAGFAVWPLVEYEADDGLAAAAALAAADPRVEQVWICTPDKDLAQCVSGTRVVQLDRRAAPGDRRGGRAREVRRRPGVDPRLSRAGRRQRGRLPGAARAGARSRPPAVLGALRPPREDPRVAPRTGQVPRARRGRARGDARSPCASDALLFRRLATLAREGPAVGARRRLALARSDARVRRDRGRPRRRAARAAPRTARVSA